MLWVAVPVLGQDALSKRATPEEGLWELPLKLPRLRPIRLSQIYEAGKLPRGNATVLFLVKGFGFICDHDPSQAASTCPSVPSRRVGQETRMKLLRHLADPRIRVVEVGEHRSGVRAAEVVRVQQRFEVFLVRDVFGAEQ